MQKEYEIKKRVESNSLSWESKKALVSHINILMDLAGPDAGKEVVLQNYLIEQEYDDLETGEIIPGKTAIRLRKVTRYEAGKQSRTEFIFSPKTDSGEGYHFDEEVIITEEKYNELLKFRKGYVWQKRRFLDIFGMHLTLDSVKRNDNGDYMQLEIEFDPSRHDMKKTDLLIRALFGGVKISDAEGNDLDIVDVLKDDTTKKYSLIIPVNKDID